jgi:hypothetical protein
VGEGATIPTMECYANAIYDAIGGPRIQPAAQL